MTADEWLTLNYHKEFFSPNPESFNELVKPYTHLQPGSHIITVGGTNGKGQTCRFLAQLLNKEKKTFCLWTSPHLKSVTERFVSHKGQIADEELLELFQRKKQQTGESQLSYYEFLFLCFLDFVQSLKPEYLILEVGMGGRLDAVNSLDCDQAAIVSVSRDHQEFLGKNLKQILFEKMGIARKGRRLTTSFESDYLRNLCSERSLQEGVIHKDLFSEGRVGKKDDFPKRNAQLSIELYEHSLGRKLEEKNREDFLEELLENEVAFIEKELGGRTLFLKGTHNVDGMRKLVHFLYSQLYNRGECRGEDRLLLSFSKRSQSDLESMVKIAKAYPCLFKDITLYAGEFHKACDKKTIESLANKFEIQWTQDWKQWIYLAAPGERIFITGSNYFVGEVCSHLDSSFSS